MSWTTNKKMAGAAATLALLAVFAALLNPEGLNPRPQFISVTDLAVQIREQKPLNIVDLRSPELFEEFHLPGAVNIPATAFSAADLDPSRQLVLYSGDDLLSRQAWSGLSRQQKNATLVLYGGVHDWFEYLLMPSLPLQASGADQQLSDQVEELSRFYGGQAEYINATNPASEGMLDYYRADLSKAPWPSANRQSKIVRRGC